MQLYIKPTRRTRPTRPTKSVKPIRPISYIRFTRPIRTNQGGITCGAIDEPRKSSKAIDERVIINFRDKNVVIAPFRDKNEVFI